MKSFVLKMSDELHKEIKHESIELNKNMNDIIIEALLIGKQKGE